MPDASAQLPLDPAQARVREILESRRKANASGQQGEDVEHIRAAYDAGNAGVSASGLPKQWEALIEEAVDAFAEGAVLSDRLPNAMAALREALASGVARVEALSKPWSVAPGDPRWVIVPGVVKPINAGSAGRARLIVDAVNAYGEPGAGPGLDATRADFERWAETEGFPLDLEPISGPPVYRDAGARGAWAAWWRLSNAPSLESAARAVVRSALDAVKVHPCDHQDDEVRARSLSPEMRELRNTLGVRVDAPTALPVLPVDDQPRPEDPLAPSWEGFTRPRPKLLRLCTINWSSSGWPDEGRGVWRIEGFAELGERTERFTLRRIAPALPGGPSGETISFYRASYESGGLTIWRKGTELADPAYGVPASSETKENDRA